jgi:archaellum biogenesis ATPase FlaH
MSRLRTASLPAPEFVIDPLIPRGHLTLFGGHGGTGKSTVALAMGAHVASGRPWAGFQTQAGRVLFLSFEDREDLVLWRLRAIQLECNLNLFSIEANLEVIDASASGPMMVEISQSGARRVVETTEGGRLRARIEAGKFDLVIIDNASDAFGGNENDRQQVRQFVKHCAGLAFTGAVVLLAHVDKSAARYGSSGNSYSGSTAWHNSARSRIALRDDEICQEKLNVGKAYQGVVALTWRGPVPVPAGAGDPTTAQREADEDDAAVLACMRAAAETGANVPTGATGPTTTWHALSVFAECPAHLKRDKPRFREAVARLERSGAIVREVYRHTDRHPRERYALATLDTDARVF